MKDQNFSYIDKPIIVPQSLFCPPYGEECYMCFVYKVKDLKEYTEGFGPSVNIRIDNEDTTWKRSRNKWNSFDKIRTSTQINNDNFEILWDQSGMNSYYVLERMYYYLDKEKHKNKFNSIRAKLYITRVHQHKDWIFLLQFITEHLTIEEQESSKRLKQKRRKSICNPPPVDIIESIENTLKNMYYPIQNQNVNNNITTTTNNNKDNQNKVEENKLEFYNQLNNLSYQQIFNFYMKEKLFPTIYTTDVDNNRISIISPSIYIVPPLNESKISNNESPKTLKRKLDTDNGNIDLKPSKKRKKNKTSTKGKVIEDEETLKNLFNNNSNNSNLIPESEQVTNTTKESEQITNSTKESRPIGLVDLLN